MSTLRVARHELVEAWRARVVLVLGAVLTLLSLGAIIVGDTRLATERAQRERYQAIVGSQFREQPDRHPHRVSHYGFLVFRPPAPLGAFDTGVQTYTGAAIFLEAHRQNSANFSDASQADGIRRFGELTPAMVLQLLVPLLIFVTTGVSVTREREAGTLPLLLCQGTRWSSILRGKLWGAAVVVLALVFPGMALAAGWLWRGSSIELSGDSIARIGLLGLALVADLVACAAIALIVSTTHRTSRAALITLVALWIGLWILVPRALPALATALHPLPSRAMFEAQVEARVRELGDSHNPDDAKFAALREQYLTRYGVSRIEDLPVNYNGIVMMEGEKLTTDAYQEFLGRLLDTYGRQSRVVEWGSLVSPYVAMRTVSMALTGVDVPHAIDFERQAEDYRYRLIQALNDLHTNEIDLARDRYLGHGEGAVPSRQRISREHWDDLPAFEYQRRSVGWAVAQQPIGIMALGAWTILALGTVEWLGRRPVRP